MNSSALKNHVYAILKLRWKLLFLSFILVINFIILSPSYSSLAAAPLTDQSEPDLEEMMDMDIGDLLNMQIVTASKELEDSFLAPGTVYVITEEDILS